MPLSSSDASPWSQAIWGRCEGRVCDCALRVMSAVSPLCAYFRLELGGHQDVKEPTCSALVQHVAERVDTPQLCMGCSGCSPTSILCGRLFCVQDPLLLIGLQCSPVKLKTACSHISQTGTSFELSGLDIRLQQIMLSTATSFYRQWKQAVGTSASLWTDKCYLFLVCVCLQNSLLIAIILLS